MCTGKRLIDLEIIFGEFGAMHFHSHSPLGVCCLPKDRKICCYVTQGEERARSLERIADGGRREEFCSSEEGEVKLIVFQTQQFTGLLFCLHFKCCTTEQCVLMSSYTTLMLFRE